MPAPEMEIKAVKETDESRLTPQVFREVMSHLASGVTIITASLKSSPVGMTATAVCSVSAKPPTLLISLTTGTRTAQGVEESKVFAVHMLAHGSQKYAEKFASVGNHFAEVKYHDDAQTGVPILEEVLGYFVCSVERSIAVADHMLFVGRVLECEVTAKGHHPLVYFDRSYRRVVHVPEGQAASLEPWGSAEDMGLPGWGVPI